MENQTKDYVDVRELLGWYAKVECEGCGKVLYKQKDSLTPFFEVGMENLCNECRTEQMRKARDMALEQTELQRVDKPNKNNDEM